MARRKFTDALQALRAWVTSQGDQGPVQRVSLQDGNVTFTVKDSSDEDVTVSVMIDDNGYPHAPAVVYAPGPYEEAIARLGEQFQDAAHLHEVVRKVLEVLGHKDVDLSGAQPCPARDETMEDDGEKSQGSSGSGVNDMDEGSDYNYGSGDGDGADGGDDEDGEEEADSDDERDMIILCSTNLGRWERYEAQREEVEKTLSTTQGVALKRQIFEPKEAFAMLSKELLAFYRAQRFDYGIQTAGDDVYDWLVDLGSFSPASPLAKDMIEVQRRYVYSTVQLRIRFMRGLHPFFPPSVEVVYPHFAPPALAAVASHPMLALENWDPWRPQLEMVDQIKSFLESAARVMLDSPANDIRTYTSSCYSPLERCLARLEALSSVAPLCQEEFKEIYALRDAFEKDSARLQALADSKKRQREDGKDGKGRAVVWARGTGYGSGAEKSSELWDAKASEAAQRARDEEIRALLQTITASLVQEMGPRPVEPGVATAAAGGAGSSSGAGAAGPSPMEGVEAAGPSARTSATASNAAQSGAAGAAAAGPGAGAGGSTAASSSGIVADDPFSPRLGAEGCAAALGRSCLLPFIARELALTSFADMGSRFPYYSTVMALVLELCRPATEALLAKDVGGGRSLSGLIVNNMKSAAGRFVNIMGPVGKASTAVSEQPTKSLPLAPPLAGKSAQQAEQAAKEAEGTLTIAQTILQVAAFMSARSLPTADSTSAGAAGGGVERSGASASGRGGGSSSSSSKCGASTSAAAVAAAGTDYCKVMRPLQVDVVSGVVTNHNYKTSLNSDLQGPRPRAVRLAKEVASLDTLLPLSESSSIFVRVDEQQVQAWKALIVGPEDSPYSGGCFVFDFYFPSQYPGVPPQVNLQTTGGGKVRFNPNLYNCGKVCLSLLGTWSGSKGENWNVDASTTVQVLVSIQSLIMVPDPYYNEPGYESRSTEESEKSNRAYTKDVRENCVRYAMLDILKHPPPVLADVVRMHFKLRKDYILKQIQGWADEEQSRDHAYAQRLLTMRAQLEQLIATL